jgi:hypothetical protein
MNECQHYNVETDRCWYYDIVCPFTRPDTYDGPDYLDYDRINGCCRRNT